MPADGIVIVIAKKFNCIQNAETLVNDVSAFLFTNVQLFYRGFSRELQKTTRIVK